ncbi:hypothetical protein HNQ50_000401 [Silvimonas terrae]|uniref:Uncharacterized protein n=1 Tax=Silvimonas terrae TaxID=300266 RepID=A0A840RBM1_9NEIS|nr:hypothetical protein [Silvimonas terrae]
MCRAQVRVCRVQPLFHAHHHFVIPALSRNPVRPPQVGLSWQTTDKTICSALGTNYLHLDSGFRRNDEPAGCQPRKVDSRSNPPPHPWIVTSLRIHPTHLFHAHHHFVIPALSRNPARPPQVGLSWQTTDKTTCSALGTNYLHLDSGFRRNDESAGCQPCKVDSRSDPPPHPWIVTSFRIHPTHLFHAHHHFVIPASSRNPARPPQVGLSWQTTDKTICSALGTNYLHLDSGFRRNDESAGCQPRKGGFAQQSTSPPVDCHSVPNPPYRLVIST